MAKRTGVYMNSSVEWAMKGTDLRRPVFALAAQNHWPILSDEHRPHIGRCVPAPDQRPM